MSAGAVRLGASQHVAGQDERVLGPGANAMGDAEAEFTWFFRAEFPRVVRTVFLIVRDQARAEEVAQEAFLQLFDRWSKISRYERPDAWVRRVAIRLAGRLARRDRMRAVLETRFRPPAAEPPFNQPADDVLRAVRQLPPKQRAAVILFYFEDRPVAEIADLLGCTPSTARVHLHKARQRLASALNEVADDVD